MEWMSVPPSFELAMRRSIFFILLLSLYLFIGAILFRFCRKSPFDRLSSFDMERVDMKRAELLNVLWAETVARTENDWYRVANQKLDHYEKILQSHSSLVSQSTNDGSFSGSFQLAFRMITTIGAVETDELTTMGQLFGMVYSLVGIPLCLLYLDQCKKMITSIMSGWNVIAALAVTLFIGGIVADIIDKGNDSTPFVNDIFSVFLIFSTIGEETPKLRGVMSVILSMIGMSLASVSFSVLQNKLEKQLLSSEWTFSQLFGKLHRMKKTDEDGDNISNNQYRIEEEDEDDESEDC